MKNSLAMAVRTMLLLVSGVSLAQSGNMMNDGAWMGRYGGIWIPILLVGVVVGVIVMLFRRK